MHTFDATEVHAKALDSFDPLASRRQAFLFPTVASLRGEVDPHSPPCVYLTGNSLGLQPKSVGGMLQRELEDWHHLGVEGHMHGRDPWLPYHESLRGPLSRIVGAQEHEVVAMNSLTVNLHLLMLSFYRPTKDRYKIMIEGTAFPSDSYAVASQTKLHGFPDAQAVVRLRPREGEETLRTENIVEAIEHHGSELALVMLGGVNYLTGQFFDIRSITKAAQKVGALCGWDLAHAVGNVPLSLHDCGVDFACWCSYKYLNSGPGAIAGVYVHEKHCKDTTLPQAAGWWGNDPKMRFEMGPMFSPVTSADRWALSNPPIFSLTPVKASLAIFDEVGMSALRRKSQALTAYMEMLIKTLAPAVGIITPSDEQQRGCQLSLRLKGDPKRTLENLKQAGVVCDFRTPDIIRAAPVPLYNSFHDVWRFVQALRAV